MNAILESVKRLRDGAHATGTEGFGYHYEVEGGFFEEALADIVREVSERYVELPRDAYGTVTRPGDSLGCICDSGYGFSDDWSMLLRKDGSWLFVAGEGLIGFAPDEMAHDAGDPVRKLLDDYATEKRAVEAQFDHGMMSKVDFTERIGELSESYAERLRKVM